MRAEMPSSRETPLFASILVFVGVLAYANTFSVPFLYDDEITIVGNPSIGRLWSFQELAPFRVQTSVAGRPVAKFTLSVNYVIHGLSVTGYHVFNLAVHIAAGLALFGVVRRTLCVEREGGRLTNASFWLAAATALVWLVHPLQTESVTYIVQRTESLVGLFYLLTLYCVIRGADSPRPRWWHGAAILTCALGMGTKEVMVTAPLMVLLYDRVFLSSSFREALRRRRGLYLGLAATWGILLALVVPGPRGMSVRFDHPDFTVWDYALTQSRVIVDLYLPLSICPRHLVLDYGWPLFTTFSQTALPAALLVLMLSATIVAFRFRPWMGFIGAWFFVILAPSSSFVPIVTETAAEHRMYLPLASVVVLVVMGGYWMGVLVLRRWVGCEDRRRRVGYTLGIGLTVAVVVTLGTLTFQRNRDYRSALSIWEDSVRKAPWNARGHVNLGRCLMGVDRLDEAIEHFREALRVCRDDAFPRLNLAVALARKGQHSEAMACFDRLLKRDPESAVVHFNVGLVLAAQGRPDEAIASFRRAIASEPDFAEVHNALANVLCAKGETAEAVSHYRTAVKLRPEAAEPRYNLARILAIQGNTREACQHYQISVGVRPDWPPALDGLAWILATAESDELRNGPEALRLAERANSLTGHNLPQMLGTLAAAYAETGRFQDAVTTVREAIALAEANRQTALAAAMRLHLALYEAGIPCRQRSGAPEGEPVRP